MAYQGIKHDRSRLVDQSIRCWGLENFPTCNLGILLQHSLVFPDLGVPNICTLKWSERSVMGINSYILGRGSHLQMCSGLFGLVINH